MQKRQARRMKGRDGTSRPAPDDKAAVVEKLPLPKEGKTRQFRDITKEYADSLLDTESAANEAIRSALLDTTRYQVLTCGGLLFLMDSQVTDMKVLFQHLRDSRGRKAERFHKELTERFTTKL